MEDFTLEQINSAANRVREMQKRSAFAQKPQSRAERDFTEQKMPAKVAKQTESDMKNSPFSKILGLLDFKNFSADEDSKLILGIILLLSSSGADELLILALVYIML